MRVYFTGYSDEDCGVVPSAFAGASCLPRALWVACRRLGHAVRHGVPTLDAGPGDADVLVVTYGIASDRSSQFFPQCATMAAEFAARGRVVVRAFREEDLRSYANSLVFMEEPDILCRRAEMYLGECPAWVEDRLEQTSAWIASHRADPCWPTAAVGAFSWGRHHLMEEVLGHSIGHFLDYSSMIPTYCPDVKQSRSRAWALAGLHDYRAWIERQRLTWPITTWGVPTQSSHAAIPERLLVEIAYPKYWGVLCPPRGHTGRGSGYLRTRYVHAASAGCVVYGEAVDHGQMPEQYCVTSLSVETATDRQLRALAAEQATALRDNVWTAERLLAEVEGLLR